MTGFKDEYNEVLEKEIKRNWTQLRVMNEAGITNDFEGKPSHMSAFIGV